jgi:hypothetical protein
MNRDTVRRAVATTELLLVAPGRLFMAALVVRGLQPQVHEPGTAPSASSCRTRLNPGPYGCSSGSCRSLRW